ncbi:MAG: hypothetical protein ACR2Q4_21980, partial [Geminicoccaceae bacterium]
MTQPTRLQRSRLQRPRLERTAPIRNLGKAFDQTGEAPGAKQAAYGAVDHGVHGGGHDGGPGLQDAVSEGVRLGYSVIE